MAGRRGSPFEVPTISAAETQAEKVLSFLRRFSQHRSGQMQRAWDTALVRHIYDVHCIYARHPEFVDGSAVAFAALVQGDVVEFGKQHADFAKDPRGVLERTLAQVCADEQSRTEYEQNLLPLVYGNFKPHFDEAFASFQHVARTFLGAENQPAKGGVPTELPRANPSTLAAIRDANAGKTTRTTLDDV